ncbi:hypothetical protein DFA_06062 [Cavenderia fasciculata]|uniref:Uncharacterized protein n=1 Tax=Cavenderia fasciculata TaxID=261658 RepID=F4PK00_CACFS|nr:uncharacterized protein DFA_06062 [Cavenderia fasciculata]EGG23924.1 hypothetical protein DFA_06062 [Cavenderia fasciculata]|eukprot:XP_004361775.1 hypothetical protein DFA_06062 [Cavenderia fasciculata]
MNTTTLSFNLQYEEKVKNVLHYNIYLRKLVYSFVIKLNDGDFGRNPRRSYGRVERGTINSFVCNPSKLHQMFDYYMKDRETVLVCYLLVQTSFKFDSDYLLQRIPS